MDFLNNFFVEKKNENGKDVLTDVPKTINKPIPSVELFSNQQVTNKLSPSNETINIGSNGQPLEQVKSEIKVQHIKSKSFNFPGNNESAHSKAPLEQKDLDKMFSEFVFEDVKTSTPELKPSNFNNGFNEDFFNFNNKFEPFSNNLNLFNQQVQMPKIEKGFDLNPVKGGNADQINFNEFNFVEDNFSKKGKMW